jgi:DNA mismatch endonuclease (patch repair protein)
MAAIKGRDTRPEKLLRSALHRAGFRFRLNADLPGKPDVTLPKYKATIFVHGCFWHRHTCPRFKQPGGENAAFWQAKLNRNAARDAEVSQLLLAAGWRQLVLWECALVGRGRRDPGLVVREIGLWLSSQNKTAEMSGDFP